MLVKDVAGACQQVFVQAFFQHVFGMQMAAKQLGLNVTPSTQSSPSRCMKAPYGDLHCLGLYHDKTAASYPPTPAAFPIRAGLQYYSTAKGHQHTR